MTKLAKHAKKITASIPTIRRLPSYLQVAKRHRDSDCTIISGTTIAEELDLEAIQVRKDLAVTGISGKPRVGYSTDELISTIEKFLGWDQCSRAIIVGAGNLGSALMGYKELRHHGLHLVAAFDQSPSRLGTKKSGIVVYPMTELQEIVKKTQPSLAILTVPPTEAQTVCDALTEVKIKYIWNFTNVHVRVPEDVLVLKEDLSSGFAVLTVLQNITV